MIPFLIAALASLPILFSAHEKPNVEKYRLPCLPDTVEVIGEQFAGCDTVLVGGIAMVKCRVILCVPEGVDLEERDK